MVCEFLLYFLTNSMLSGGLLATAFCVQPAQDVGPWEKRPAVCFVVNGSEAHSEDSKLNEKKTPRAWFSHFLFSQNQCLSVQFPGSGAVQGASFYAHLIEGGSRHTTQGGCQPQTVDPPSASSSRFIRASSKDVIHEDTFLKASTFVINYHLLLWAGGLCSFIKSFNKYLLSAYDVPRKDSMTAEIKNET